ncbi:response regulator [Vibrio coralliilyticus]|uniref:Sensory/regulatory protein RpfC n=1 Tax=Vibrio coralliilyticus TaxID=190893 RepID=A0AAN0VZJ6_9VIBR|nr:response regulator [Vibrio coralliilyticus]AIW21113.1 histidine kinase [Vibrio coralliilyticus]NOH40119.1 response regulator [Vibrio coralliilyticus]
MNSPHAFRFTNDDESRIALRRKLISVLDIMGYDRHYRDQVVFLCGEILFQLFSVLDSIELKVKIHDNGIQTLWSSAEGSECLPRVSIPLLSISQSEDELVWTLNANKQLSENDFLNIKNVLSEKTRDDLMHELQIKNRELAIHQEGLEEEIERRTRDLQASEALSRTIIEGAPSSVVILDAHKKIVLWNKTAIETYGYSVEEATGQNLFELLRAELPLDLSELFSQDITIEDQDKVSGAFFEVQTYTRGDKPIPIDLGMTMFLFDDECRIAMFLRDVTSRKQVEDELNEARAKAEEAVEIKSMFLANMSHEIRTPMNAIIGMSHLALKTDLTPKQHDYISKIHNSASLLLGIINDILDFSKIEAGKLSIEEIEFYLDDVLHNVSMVTGQKAFEKGLELLFDIPRDVPKTLYGDPLRLGQIIINLVNNAVKFTEQGEISVSVKVIRSLDDKIELGFSVKDTGIGMSEEQSSKLFNAFTQADGSTTRKYGGTGLGLSICRRLVELMGGEISVDSELDVGSTFRFNILVGAVMDSGYTPVVVPDLLNHVHALVVDDNEHALLIMEDLLDIFLCKPTFVSSGERALEELKKASDAGQPYDLVFMDWKMPTMSGIEASQQIRQQVIREHQPKIVIVTAYDKDDISSEVEELDIAGFLSKPVGQSYLFDLIMDLFGPTNNHSTPGVQSRRHKRDKELDGLRVLLVEDNEINQQIAVELMEEKGITVTVANNGAQAIETLEKRIGTSEMFEIIFMDLQMPVMDGYEASTRIRSDARYDDIPLIAMTAHAMVEERERCLNIGMNDHVSKPIDPEHLFSTIKRCCQNDFTQNFTPISIESTERTEETLVEEGAKSVASSLQEIDSLDTKNGLLRVASNEALYHRLLSQLVDKEYDYDNRLDVALDKGDFEYATLITHTLKGTAANLGAIRLSDIASRLEQELGRGEHTESLEQLKREISEYLKPFFNAICDALNRPQPLNTKDKLDNDSVKVIHQLDLLLQELDARAIDYLDEHYLYLNTLLGSEEFDTCCKCIHDCDFLSASVALRKAASIYPLDMDKVFGGNNG